jgi:hypothetical protein
MAHVYNEIQLTSFLDQISWRLRLLEAQVARMAEEQEMPYEDAASMTPARAVELLGSANAPTRRQSAVRQHGHRPIRSAPAAVAC